MTSYFPSKQDLSLGDEVAPFPHLSPNLDQDTQQTYHFFLHGVFWVHFKFFTKVLARAMIL